MEWDKSCNVMIPFEPFFHLVRSTQLKKIWAFNQNSLSAVRLLYFLTNLTQVERCLAD